MSRLRLAAQRELDLGRPERAWDLVAGGLDAPALQDRVVARRLLQAIAARIPEAAWTEARQAAAKLAGIARPPAVAQVGAMRFPAVEPSGEGRFIEVGARLIPGDEDDLFVPRGDARRASLQGALDAARAWLDDRSLRFALHFDADWTGESVGLAVALAAISAARRAPVSPLFDATGAVDADGRVRPVGLIAGKLSLRHHAHPRARLLLPADDDPGYPAAMPVANLSAAWEAIGGSPTTDLEGRLAHLRALDSNGDWLEAAREAEGLVDEGGLEDGQRLELLVMLLIAANHTGADAESQRWDARLEALSLAFDSVDNLEDLARAIGSRAVRHIDALDPEGARRALSLADGRYARRASRVHLDGPAALCATLTGQHAQALTLRQASVAVARPAEQPRCLGDLADALLRVGQPEEALAQLVRAVELAKVDRHRPGYQHRVLRFLRLHQARALAALGRPDEARATLDLEADFRGIDPALRKDLLRAELDGDLDAVARLRESVPEPLRASRIVGALIDRSAARLGDREAETRFLDLAPFVGLDLAEAARRLPY